MMNRPPGISVLLTVLCLVPAAERSLAADTLHDALQETRIHGQLRYFILQRDYDELVENPGGVFAEKESNTKFSSAVGGYLGFESGSWHNVSIGATLYTSQPVFHNPTNEGGLQLLKDNQHGYGVLGQAFVRWQYNDTTVKIGRQLLSDYRFLSDNDIRMTPYTYEAAIVENRSLENITLRLAGVYGVQKMADTSYVGFVEASRDLLRETTIDRNPIRGDYDPDNFDENYNYTGSRKNLYLGSAVYQDKAFNLEVWDYFCSDFVNFLYVTGSWSTRIDNLQTQIGIQGIKQDNVGDHVAGSIDTYTYGLLVKGTWNDLSLQYAYSRVKYDENSLDGGSIIDYWGGSMLYNSLTYNGADQGGTTGNSLTLTWALPSLGLNLLCTAARFDLPDNLTDFFADQDNSEYDFILRYTLGWNTRLNFKIAAAYIDFDTNYDFKAYEDLHGWNFLHTYDDILDLRFVVNYTF